MTNDDLIFRAIMSSCSPLLTRSGVSRACRTLGYHRVEVLPVEARGGAPWPGDPPAPRGTASAADAQSTAAGVRSEVAGGVHRQRLRVRGLRRGGSSTQRRAPFYSRRSVRPMAASSAFTAPSAKNAGAPPSPDRWSQSSPRCAGTWTATCATTTSNGRTPVCAAALRRPLLSSTLQNAPKISRRLILKDHPAGTGRGQDPGVSSASARCRVSPA